MIKAIYNRLVILSYMGGKSSQIIEVCSGSSYKYVRKGSSKTRA